ncbi:MGH1-like glycoside hydrolase domain-containing protein [Calidifontibacter terrae]
MSSDAEITRLSTSAGPDAPWRLWGPYVSGRQWGTVREDYSADGNAWDYFPFDHAHRRAYRWGEDGLGAFCDRFGFFNLGIALWNRADDRLKERCFGLTNAQGNHGEDVKEVWWPLDGTPTHSYASWLYRYPQGAYPYADLLAQNAARDRNQPEYELTDTGVLAGDRFFDVVVDYAKQTPTDLVMRVTATNYGPDPAPLDLVVQGWFRNTWRWGDDDRTPSMRRDGDAVVFHHDWLGDYRLVPDAASRILFCDNETDESLFEGMSPVTDCPKDGLDRAIVRADTGAVRDDHGTKVGFLWSWDALAPGETRSVSVRLTAVAAAVGDEVAPYEPAGEPLSATALFDQRRVECDDYYATVIPPGTAAEDALIARRAFSGLLWGKQLFRYDIGQWLDGDADEPAPPAQRRTGRNHHWGHLELADIISMPDEWEYPWFATWDLAFHAVALAHVDPDLAKQQLELICREWSQHPNGQLPAYEWNFDDVNPPVHAWACWQVFIIDGGRDHDFLVRVFSKLLLNFSWWINRKDADGSYLFEGGFLGMDNIGFFDRSTPLPDGHRLEQSDATSWMAFYALSMMRIAIELSERAHAGFDATARTFFEYFLRLSQAMDDFGSQGVSLWNEEDGFFYDAIVTDAGEATQLPVRSMVGLLPLIAVESVHPALHDEIPELIDELRWLARRDPRLEEVFVRHQLADTDRITLALVGDERRARLFQRLFDEAEFLSPHGLRALSAVYREPLRMTIDGHPYEVAYAPAESTSALFGGNSNWRGPVWFPVNALLVDALHAYAIAEPDATFEFPTGSGRQLALGDVGRELSDRLVSLFRAGSDGRRPGTPPWYPSGPLWDDHVTFSEYFDGDTGAGVGATHQTGWTAMVAHLICSPDGLRR